MPVPASPPKVFAPPTRRTVAGVLLAVALAVTVVAGRVVVGDIEQRMVRHLPPPVAATEIDVSAVVLDRQGLLLRPFATENDYWRLPVTLDAVDPRFLGILVAYEDRPPLVRVQPLSLAVWAILFYRLLH